MFRRRIKYHLLQTSTAGTKSNQIICMSLSGEIYSNCCCNCVTMSLDLLFVRPVALTFNQYPRFCGVTTKQSSVVFYCQPSDKHLPAGTQWYRAAEYNAAKKDRTLVEAQEQRIEIFNNNPTSSAYLIMHKPRTEDSGVYFCRINDTWGPGTELLVTSKRHMHCYFEFLTSVPGHFWTPRTSPHPTEPFDHTQALHRTNMKDALIVLQGLMLAVCIAAVLLRKQIMVRNKMNKTRWRCWV